ACPEAHNGQQREAAIACGLAHLDAQPLTHLIAHPLISHDPSAYTVADHDNMSPHGLAKDQVVECRDAVEIFHAHPKELRQILETLVRYPSAMSLDDLHGINTHGLFCGIVRQFSFNLLL